MLRFISHLFKLNYEECKGCETLKKQLEIANNDKKELMETLLGIVKPKSAEPVTIQTFAPVIPKGVLPSRRRAMLEEQSRAEAGRIAANSPFIANKDAVERQESIKELEKELDLIQGEEHAG